LFGILALAGSKRVIEHQPKGKTNNEESDYETSGHETDWYSVGGWTEERERSAAKELEILTLLYFVHRGTYIFSFGEQGLIGNHNSNLINGRLSEISPRSIHRRGNAAAHLIFLSCPLTSLVT
jgi:hypothetical protein